MSTEHLSTISNGSIHKCGNFSVCGEKEKWRQKNTPQNSKQTMNNISNENVATEIVNIGWIPQEIHPIKLESNESKKCLC